MRTLSSLATLSLFGLVVAAGGCAASSGPACRVGADCASGACGLDGQCVPAMKTDSGAQNDAATDAADDATNEAGGDAPSDAPIVGCSPNHDGTIEAKEVPLGPGLKATFRVAKNVTFATAGTANGDGSRTWDLSVKLSGDTDTLVQTQALAGAWYAGNFPDATYATTLSAQSDLLGVFRLTDSAVLLEGVVSPTDGTTKTELTYSPANTVLGFPFKVGSAWKVTSNVTGTASGVLANYTEAYDTKVDAHGKVITPFGSFDALRVKVVLTRTVGFSVTVTRTYAFVTECFGTIASITSQPNETADEFTNASEVRRIAP